MSQQQSDSSQRNTKAEKARAALLALTQQYPQALKYVSMMVMDILSPMPELQQEFEDICEEARKVNRQPTREAVRQFYKDKELWTFWTDLRKQKQYELLLEIYQDLRRCTEAESLLEKYQHFDDLKKVIRSCATANKNLVEIAMKSCPAHIVYELKSQDLLEEGKQQHINDVFEQLNELLLEAYARPVKTQLSVI